MSGKTNRRAVLAMAVLFVGIGCAITAGQVIANSNVDTEIGTDLLQVAPEFTLADIDGRAVTLSELRGRDILLVFGNTRCPYCAAKVPLLNELDGDGFKVVFVAMGCTRSDAIKYIRQENIQFDVLLDSDGSVGKVYGVKKVPEAFLIDSEGIIQYGGSEEGAAVWHILAGKEIPQEVTTAEDLCESNYALLTGDCENREPYLRYEPTVIVKPDSNFSIPIFVNFGDCPESEGVYHVDLDEDNIYEKSGLIKRDSFAIKGRFYTEGNHRVKGKVEGTYGTTYFSMDVYVTEEKKTSREVRMELYPGLYSKRPKRVTAQIKDDDVRKRHVVLFQGYAEERFWIDINLAYHVLNKRYNFTDEEIILLTPNYDVPEILTDFNDLWIDGISNLSTLEDTFADFSNELDGDDLLFFVFDGHGDGYSGPRARRPYFNSDIPDSIYDGPINISDYDDPDYKESEFQTELILSGGTNCAIYGGVTKAMDKFLPCFYSSSLYEGQNYYRFKVVSHFENLPLLDGSIISDNDIYIEKIICYAKCDFNRDTIIDEGEIEFCDWDGDGTTLLKSGKFDEDDWLDKYAVEENYHPYNTVQGINGLYYCLIDWNLDNTLDMVGFQSDANQLYLDCLAGLAEVNDLSVTGSDTDNDGYANYLDINLDGDLNDYLSFDETLQCVGGDIYDDELANLFATIDPNTTKIFLTESCMGGGFLRDLSYQNVISMSASEEDDESHDNYFIRHFFMALNGGCEQFGVLSVDCNSSWYSDIGQNLDLDSDGLVSIAEAFRKSYERRYDYDYPMYDDNGDLEESYGDSLTLIRDLVYSVPNEVPEGVYGDTTFLDPNFFGDVNQVACYDFDGPLNFSSLSEVIHDGNSYTDYADQNEVVDYVCDGQIPSNFAVRFTVYFADANLKATVETELGISDPNATDMLALTALDASSSGIADLTGLEYALNLAFLDLTDNPLNRKAYCKDLPLIAANNPGVDLRHDPDPEPLNCPVDFVDFDLQAAVEAQLGIAEPNLADMLGLTELTAYNKDIVKLTGMEAATNLTYLNLQENQITDINPLAGLTNLTNIYLYGNQITDINALAGLTNLTTISLYDNQIADINSLAGLTNLTYLYLWENQIADINSLAELTNLRGLYLQENQITDINPLAGLTNLTYLKLQENQITDINSLAGLTKLRTLFLYDNQITDISSLAALTNLTTLYLSENQITDISSLVALTNLTKIYLSRNQVSDLSALSQLAALTELPLHYNQISDISVLSELENLEKLNFQNNQISDISSLSDANNLDWLGLNDNQLNTPAYCTYLPLIAANNLGIDLRYDTNPNPLTNDCSTDFRDFAVFALHWLQAGCEESTNWCGGTDLTGDGNVNWGDLAELVNNWLAGK